MKFLFFSLIIAALTLTACSDYQYFQSSYSSKLKHRGRCQEKKVTTDKSQEFTIEFAEEIQKSSVENQRTDFGVVENKDTDQQIEQSKIVDYPSRVNQQIAFDQIKNKSNTIELQSISSTTDEDLVSNQDKINDVDSKTRKGLIKEMKIVLILALAFLASLLLFLALFSSAPEFVLYILIFSMAAISFLSFVLCIIAIVKLVKKDSEEKGFFWAVLFFFYSAFSSFFFVMYFLSFFT